MKRVIALGLFVTLSGLCLLQAQTSPAPTRSSKKRAVSKTNSAVLNQLNELKQAIDAQQQQIKQLSDQVQSRDQQIQQLQQSLQQSQAAASDAATKANSAATDAAKQADAVTALRSDVTDLKQNATNTTLALQETQLNIKNEIESPAAIHYKGVTITPGGFVEAATVNRTRATSADINTPFTGIPYSANALSRVSESNFT